jgi:hypothetical protein
MRTALIALLLIVTAEAALAVPCQERRSRDPSFIQLVVPDDAVRPKSPEDFSFVTDDTTIDQMTTKVGPPDASSGDRLIHLVYCFADGRELVVTTRDRVAIQEIRVDGRKLFKRGKKK